MTLPTTIYQGDRPKLAGAIAADRHVIRHEHVHWTLIILLVLTQSAVGAYCFDVALQAATSVLGNVSTLIPSPLTMPVRTAALVVGVIGIAAGTFHLGRPWLAYRALIGLRHSWLSREILAFGVFIKSAAVYTFLTCYGEELQLSPVWQSLFGLLAVAGGLAGVWCSAMIYIFTKRPFWNQRDTYRKFFGTTIVCGLTCLAFNQIISPIEAVGADLWGAGATIGLLTVVMTLKCLMELSLYAGHSSEDARLQQKSKQLFKSDLKAITLTRLALALTGPLLLFLSVLCITQSPGFALSLACTGGLLVLGGEVAERYCFFAGVVAHKMPGAITT